ncbi:MAG: helix-turn-helix domain-containing protein, partial [Paracoccaceae bacterium]
VAALDAEAQFALLELSEAGPGLRVLAGTYRDIDAEVEQGRFNPDLFYRLDVTRVRIPALHERPEDIPVLFSHYVDIACEQAALPRPEITPEVNARLMAQDWPGNARSLMNAAMRFAMGLNEVEAPEDEPAGLAEQLARVERSLLIEALRRAEGHATEAAQALKLPRKTFYDKLSRHGIRPEVYR